MVSINANFDNNKENKAKNVANISKVQYSCQLAENIQYNPIKLL
jgi:hypothetical protein